MSNVKLNSSYFCGTYSSSPALIAALISSAVIILSRCVPGSPWIPTPISISSSPISKIDVPFAGAGKAINLLDHLDLLNNSKGKLDVVAGQKADGKFEVVDISKAPHMLIAGTTGSGKTIFLYSIIVSLLKKYPMEDLEFLIVDPKQTDFVFFEDLPNLYGGHVVTDAEEALTLIQRINDVDKEERMAQIRSCRSRDIDSYNEKNPTNRMKRLVIIIDEYADFLCALA